MLWRAISLAIGVRNAMVGEVSIYRIEWFHFSDMVIFQHTLKNSDRGDHEISGKRASRQRERQVEMPRDGRGFEMFM